MTAKNRLVNALAAVITKAIQKTCRAAKVPSAA